MVCDVNGWIGNKKGARVGMQSAIFVADELDHVKLLLQYGPTFMTFILTCRTISWLLINYVICTTGADVSLVDANGKTATSYHRNDAIGIYFLRRCCRWTSSYNSYDNRWSIVACPIVVKRQTIISITTIIGCHSI
jgi:hypothetical protein